MRSNVRRRTQQRRKHHFQLESPEIEELLKKSCIYVAQYWADILRLNLFNTNVQNFSQWLVTQTNPLNRKLIDRFQLELAQLVFDEISALEYSPENPDEHCLDFDRWVGCWEHGPNTYLAEVCQALSISFLYFPSQTGWYVNPSRVINRFGEIRMV
jgi:tRNA A37 N6-isopentenylltransferase MiaA